MILEFRLSTNRDTILASASQVDFSAEIRNMAGHHVRSKQIVSIGDTAEDMRKNAPEYWERNGKHIEFLHPFNFDETLASTGQYEPLIAARIVQWLSNKAFTRMKRNSVKRMILSPWMDRVDYTLDLEGFEKLPAETRRQFVKHLKKLLVAIRRVEINGAKVLGR